MLQIVAILVQKFCNGVPGSSITLRAKSSSPIKQNYGTKTLSFKQRDLKNNEIKKVVLNNNTQKKTSVGKIVLAKPLKRRSRKIVFIHKNPNEENPLLKMELTVKIKKKNKNRLKLFEKRGNKKNRYPIKVKLKKGQVIKNIKVKAGFRHSNSLIKTYSWRTFKFKARK